MSLGTLYAGPYSRALSARGLVSYFNLDINIKTEKDDVYTKNFPLGKFPAFVGPKGFKMTEAIAIVYYLINLADKESPLLGKSDNDKAKVLSWVSLANSDLLTQIAHSYLPIVGVFPYNRKAVTDANAAANKIVDIFEQRLAEHTFLVGERITLADIFSATVCEKAFALLWGTEWRAQHPNFMRWFKTVITHPVLSTVMKDIKYTDKPAEYVAPKKEKKEQKPAAAKAPKAEKKAAPKAEVEEEKPVEEKKPKHPLELLGKSTKFNLDEWKRTYSNEETREVALPWFWEHYDPTEWSLWKVEYKYNDELTLTFMSNNLVGGFFNRLSASTKYLFGSGVVYGENNNNGIIGVFLVRGQEHAPAFDVAPDWESYEFTKLDGEKDRELVNDIFAWDKPLVINGETREIADGKVFK